MFPARNQDVSSTNDSNNVPAFQVMSESAPLKPGKINNEIGFRYVILACVVVAIGVTVALVIHKFYAAPILIPIGVVSDNEQCSTLGSQVIRDGGSAVDAVITTYLCLCVVHPHVAGLGGGGFMIIRDNKENVVSLNFREAAPIEPIDQTKTRNPIWTVGVPGVIRGLSTAHEMFGILSWSNLVNRASSIARNGFQVSPFLAQALQNIEPNQSPSIYKMFNGISSVGQKMKSQNLAKTLDELSRFGADAFYKGTLAQTIVQQIQNRGGLLTLQDFANYTTVVGTPFEITWQGYRLRSTTSPSSGANLLSALSLFETFNGNASFSELVIPILQNWKLSSFVANQIDPLANSSFANQLKTLIDLAKKNTNEWTMTAQVTRDTTASSVLAVDDNEIFVTLISGLGSWFGSQIVTAEGIILNNALADFALDPDFNMIKSADRPPTSMSAIVIDEELNPCGLRLVTSGSSSLQMLQVLLENLFLHKTVSDSLDAPRFDYNDKVFFMDKGFESLVDANIMQNISSNLLILEVNKPPYTTINLLSKIGNDITEGVDPRSNVTSVNV